MLTLSHIRKDYGKFTAVEDINLELENGLYAMLAPNGAGKTTLIKMITTLLYPTSGEILYDGMDIYKMGETYRDVIGYLPQHFGYYKNNTPTQYLDYLAALKGISKEAAREKIPELLELVGLSDVFNKKMKKFSGGMIQRVGIAQAMLNDPKILVLDKPTAGLDPKERVRFRNILSVLSKDRIVILSTHIVSDIESIANHVIMIKEKQLLKNDTVPNVVNPPAAAAAEPVCKSSLYVNPGSRKCTCTSINPGAAIIPEASMTCSMPETSSTLPICLILFPSNKISVTRSNPLSGSITLAFLIKIISASTIICFILPVLSLLQRQFLNYLVSVLFLISRQ